MIRSKGGMYINATVPPGSSIAIQNNDFIYPTQHVLQVANNDAPIRFCNNIVVTDPGVPIIVRDKPNISITECNNLMRTNIEDVGFVNPAIHDYHITATSPARDAGADASSYFNFDFEYDSRSDGAFDIGADEYRGSGCPVVFTQDFSSSTVVADYVGSAFGKLDHMTPELNGGTWSISGGRLVLDRTGAGGADNAAGFTRYTDFGCAPTVLHVAFSLAVSNWTLSQFQSAASCMQIGNFTGWFDYSTGGALGNVFSSLCVKGLGGGNFTFTTAGGQAAPSFPANGTPVAVSYLLNKSGASTTYKGPDNTTRSLGANSVAVWAGTTLLFDNVPASNGSTSALTDLRAYWANTEDATWSLDNLVIRAALPQ